jgi:hypothetical protein
MEISLLGSVKVEVSLVEAEYLPLFLGEANLKL